MQAPELLAPAGNLNNLRYAIAYALFKTGDFEDAERHLAQLNRPDLFRKAAELRRAIQDCTEDHWKCL